MATFVQDDSTQLTTTIISSNISTESVFALTTNLNNLSTNSILSINNLNNTSTTIFTNLNSLSTNSILSINNLNNTSTTIFTNLNSLSSNSTLSITNLNNTSTTLLNKTNFTNLFVSGASTLLSSLNIVGNIIGSGTALTNLNYNAITNKPDLTTYATNTNLNSLSTNSTLSINNLNNTSTTIFTNLNSLSTNSILSINNLNNTSTTIFTNLNSLSSNSTLSITNLNNTKQNTLTFSSPLINTSNNITIDLSLYDTIALRNSALGSYLPKTGGTLTGPLTTGNITISGTTGRLNVIDDYHYIEFSQSSDITTIQEYGTIKFNIGQTKTTRAYVNLLGLTATAFFGNGAGITSLDYNNILTNKPTNFPADWLTTIINKPTIYTQSETNTLLNAKQDNLTFSNPFLNTSNTITLKYNTDQFNIDSSGNLNFISGSGISQWTTSGTSIYYNTGNVGIGKIPAVALDVLGNINALGGTIAGKMLLNGTVLNDYSLQIKNNNYTCPVLCIDAGGSSSQGSPNSNARAIGMPLLGIGANSYNGLGDYYGIGLGYCSLPTRKYCCEIGCIITNTAAGEYGDLLFSLRNTTVNTDIATERMRITSNGNVGIGTINNIVSKLTINDIVNDRWTYDHSTAPLTITNQTATGTTLNDPQPILNLCRQGSSGVSYGARCTFKLCRYENSGTNSRTRMDIVLSNNYYNEELSVMNLKSDGNVGIGITNSNCRLYISSNLAASATVYAMRISSGASTDGGGFGTLIGLGSEPNGWSKCAIGHTRMGAYDIGDIVFLCRGTLDGADCTMSDEKMRIKTNGNVSITGTLTSGNISCPAITCTNSSTALYVNGGGNSLFTGKIGVSNLFPQSMLHLGSCDVVGSAPVIIFGKNTGGGNRNAFMGYTDTFFFVIGDYGNTNTSTTLTQQVAILYSAPLSIVIAANGYVVMQYGSGTGSDERIKTNIKTIENALDKTLLLRGVEYNDIRIEPERKKIGLIAQEVELIVPEVVRTSEEDGLKSIEYQNLVGLLIEAIKDQQKQINELKNNINKIII